MSFYSVSIWSRVRLNPTAQLLLDLKVSHFMKALKGRFSEPRATPWVRDESIKALKGRSYFQ